MTPVVGKTYKMPDGTNKVAVTVLAKIGKPSRPQWLGTFRWGDEVCQYVFDEEELGPEVLAFDVVVHLVHEGTEYRVVTAPRDVPVAGAVAHELVTLMVEVPSEGAQ